MVRKEHNTPVIIKYPFWQMTAENPQAVSASVYKKRIEIIRLSNYNCMTIMLQKRAKGGKEQQNK